MKTDDLIVQLAAGARPITRLRSPFVRLGQWSAWALVIAGSGVFLIKPRADFASAIGAPTYAASLVLLILTAAGAAAAALVLAVPGAERSPLQRWLPLASGVSWPAVWVAATVTSRTPDAPSSDLFHVACALEIVLFAAAAGIVLWQMVARAAPLRMSWTRATVAVAAVACAAAATQVICPIGDPGHQVVSHVLVAALVGLVGILAGHRMLPS